ncbi:hypothetical protein CPB84DRAFT_1765984 [Gymnopilus junonius]|uniref:Uncharacterized protein n=1 Tax=Gymnopilus junonius TaxID=109634 RepID=A0A9P5NX42_GYMJU|nr:hypothetical protein CPB84DRAFT_1765984 [Gymnopilus junonius]
MTLLPFSISYLVLTPKRVRLPGELTPSSSPNPPTFSSFMIASDGLQICRPKQTICALSLEANHPILPRNPQVRVSDNTVIDAKEPTSQPLFLSKCLGVRGNLYMLLKECRL